MENNQNLNNLENDDPLDSEHKSEIDPIREKSSNGAGGKDKKTIWVFSWASFLNDVGAEMISPVWPIFVTQFLGAPLAFLGFLDGLGDALVSLSQAASGILSDRIRKQKIFIWIGYLFAGFARLGYGISHSYYRLIPFKILDRSGKIRDAPRDAMVSFATSRKNRATAFGLLESMDSLGATVGVILSILLFGWLGFRPLFFLAAIPSFFGALLVLSLVREKPQSKVAIGEKITFRFREHLSKNLKLFILISAIFNLGFFSYSFLLLRAQDFGFKPFFIPVLYLIFTVSTSLAAIPMGKLADRYHRKPIIILAYSFWAIVSLGFIKLTSGLIIVALFILYGFYKAALEPTYRSFIAEESSEQFRAGIFGSFKMIMGLMAFPASLIAGILADKFGRQAPFYLSFFLAVIAIILMFFVKEKKES